MKKRAGIKLILLAILIVLLILLGWLVYHFYLYSSGELVDVQLPSNPECEKLQDDYVRPDFNALKTKLSSEQIVKDTPDSSKIVLMFYHDVENCRMIDKIYLLRDGKIEERNVVSDVEILLHSDYVDDLMTDSLCDVSARARSSGDLIQKSSLEMSQLLWAYKSMVSHRECLGV
jgi:hypothetical protein